MIEYADWVDGAYTQKTSDRVGLINGVIENFAGHSEKSERLAESLADLKEFEKPSFLTHIHFIPIDRTEPGYVRHLMFSEPMISFRNKKLNFAIGVTKKNKTVRDGGFKEDIEAVEKGSEEQGVRQILSWTRVVSSLSAADKQKLIKLLIDGYREQRNGKDQDESWFSDFLEKEKEFEIVGFAANNPYINVDAKFGSTKPLWVHPWGLPALLLRHRELPAIMMASPTMRLNENINGSKAMEGWTG